VLFISHISTGLGLPISSFFLLLLEDFGLQLQHLTPHSILMTSIFVHLCEMFVGVRPCVIIFRHFFVLVKSGKGKVEVGAYYFQTRSDLRTPYITGLTGGKWEDWRKELVIATTKANERLVMPTGGPASDRQSWRAKPSLPSEFDSVLSKIRALAEGGLTSLHVLGDFLMHRIAPLKQRPRPAWSITGPQDCSRTHRWEDSDLTQEGLEVLVRAVTGEIFVPEHLILPQRVVPLCEDSRLRTAVLATLPTLDDGGLAARQTGGDPDRGIRIPGASGEQAVPSARGSGPSAKGKQAVAGSVDTSGPSQDRSSSGASSGEAGRRRLHRGDGTPVTEPAANRQRTAEDAGQGSSRAPGSRGTSGVAVLPPPPPGDASPRQQQQ